MHLTDPGAHDSAGVTRDRRLDAREDDRMELPRLIAALSDPAAYPFAVDAVEVRQTHISVVFLAGPYVYKLKKPVRLAFLDFSTLEQRQHFCLEELRLNRRLAAEVYLDVVPVVAGHGRVRFEGEGA